MKIIRVFIAMAALIMLFGISDAAAQITKDQPPCIIINGVKCYVQYDDCGRIIAINCPGGSTGQAQFSVLDPGDPCAPDGATELDPDKGEPLNAFILPKSISVSVPDATYGTITTTLDASRTQNYTTIATTDEARERGDVFPAKVRIRFYAFASLDAEPDTRYVSQSELVFGNDGVNSAAPFSNETFTLLNDVNYYRQGDEKQTTVFTLQAGTTNLTIDGEGDGGDQNLH